MVTIMRKPRQQLPQKSHINKNCIYQLLSVFFNVLGIVLRHIYVSIYSSTQSNELDTIIVPIKEMKTQTWRWLATC